jgi:nucleoside-diphosphate-sugar epimerase
MKVFVTGATGYIGYAVAAAFRRAGHEVWGLVRNREKVRILEESEICPVLGTLQEPASYLPAAEPCSLLVHAAVDYQADTFALERKAVEALISTGERGSRPKTVLYTSGTWIYGDTGSRLVDETAPASPVKRMAARPGIEQLVLNSDSVRGLVVRPGCVYGRSGGMTGDWFDGAHNKKALAVVGDGTHRWAMVHSDDLAEGFLRVGESGLAGEVFNLADSSRSTVREMATAAARAAGYLGEIRWVSVAEASKTMGDFAECLVLSQHIDAGKAARLLGWHPRHGGFVDDAETYFLSWKAAQEKA